METGVQLDPTPQPGRWLKRLAGRWLGPLFFMPLASAMRHHGLASLRLGAVMAPVRPYDSKKRKM